MMRLVISLHSHVRVGLIAFFILLLDQSVKQFLLHWFDQPWWFLSSRIGVHVVFNEGIAFSLPLPGILSIILPSFMVAGIIVYYHSSISSSFIVDVAFGFIIGGALGNILDRLMIGKVVDYIQVFNFPTFNLADSAITVGFMLFLYSVLFTPQRTQQ